MHLIIKPVLHHILHNAALFLLSRHPYQVDRTQRQQECRSKKHPQQYWQAFLRKTEALPKLVELISGVQRVADCTVKPQPAFLQRDIGIRFEIIRHFAQMVAAEARVKHKRAFLIADFALCCIPANGVARFVLNIVKEVPQPAQIADAGLIFVQLSLQIHFVIHWQPVFHQILIFLQICIKRFRNLPVNRQPVICRIDFRIVGNHPINDAIIPLKAVNDFFPLHRIS